MLSMSNKNPNDQLFSDAMKRSKLSMPFSDFEERMMARIHREEVARDSMAIYRKLAMFFFSCGTIVGFVLTYFLTLPDMGMMGMSSDTVVLLCRLMYVSIVLIQLNSILKFFSKQDRGQIG